MLERLLLTPPEALAVVLSTSGLYWAFVFLVRFLGQRALARMSSADLATAVALGAVIGRGALGYTPTLGAGILALLTLFAMQALAGQIRRVARFPHFLNNKPILIMVGSEAVEENLRKTHLAESELWPQLRLAGIHHRSEVGFVILEPTGEISVVRRGTTLDMKLMGDVRGIEHLEKFFRDEL